MLQFILNNRLVETELSASSILLDFVRNNQRLKGTKAGCREGDCGACTVLVGTLEGKRMHYISMASCLTPIGNVVGKHVVTIEGINLQSELTPVQNALHVHGGTQCGFCTPGFVVSLTGFAINDQDKTTVTGKEAVAGNICRCTGYKSIENAINDIVNFVKEKPLIGTLDGLIETKLLPDYFRSIPERIKSLNTQISSSFGFIIGGGTDLYVQKPDETSKMTADFFLNRKEFKQIIETGGYIELGASVTVNDIMHSPLFLTYFPEIKDKFKLISSEQIRNVATIAGNFVNASPIGDLSIFFLALNAELFISNGKGLERTVMLKDFFKSYKTLDLQKGEYIEKLRFVKPHNAYTFNFEKVSKRTYLDIASVNTAIYYSLEKNVVSDIHISGGGVAPIPKYFEKTRAYLMNKELLPETIQKASEILISEVSPISDIRGSKEYKTMLLKQLFLCHFN